LGPGVGHRVEGLGATHLAELGALDELGDAAGHEHLAIGQGGRGRIPAAVLHRRHFLEVVGGGVEDARAPQALELDPAEVVGIAVVAVDAVAGLVVPAGAADDELAAVGEVGEVGAEHVPGVLHAGVRAAGRVVLDAGRGAGHPATDEAADEAVTGTAGNARDPQGIGLAVVTRLEIGVDSAAGLVTGGAPGRDAAAQVEDARPAVAGLRGEFGRRAVLHVLGALDAVEVEH